MGSGWDPRYDRDLRAAAADARAEWQAEEEHWTTAALEQWQHARTLVDLAHEHLHRGDTVAVRWFGAPDAVTGRVTAVGDDSLTVETFAGRVDVSLGKHSAIGWRVVDHARRGGRGTAMSLTFRARLLELEATGHAVDVAGFDDEIVRGRLCVGLDHVQVVGADATWVLGLSAVRWVRVPAGA